MRKKIDLNFEEMDFSDIECEQIDVVEYEFSENISILYNKSTKQFSIEGLDQDTFDEYDIVSSIVFNKSSSERELISSKDKTFLTSPKAPLDFLPLYPHLGSIPYPPSIWYRISGIFNNLTNLTIDLSNFNKSPE